MRNQPHPDMLEATRLTREGRVSEATALLLRMLRPQGSTAPDADHGIIIDSKPDAVEDTRSEPSPRNTSASSIHAGSQRTDFRQPAEEAPQLPSRGPLHRFLGRLGRIGASLGTAGLRKTAKETPSEGRFITRSYANHAGNRTYKLYIPSGYQGKAVPLIIMLHGCTQSPDDFAAGTRMNVQAEENTCLVAYPAQPASANASKCWNWFNPSHQRRDEGEPSLIAGITRQIMQDHAVDSRRVYIAGLSAGGAAASILAMTYPDLYAAVGIHSGLASGAASDLASAHIAMQQGNLAASGRLRNVGAVAGRPIVPTIVFHGDQDTKVHPRNGDHVLGQMGGATRIDLDKKLQHGRVPGGHGYTRTLYVDREASTILEQWIIHGLGHAWSGGAPAGSYTDPRGPDAAREMIRFFLQHTHDRTASGPWARYGL